MRKPKKGKIFFRFSFLFEQQLSKLFRILRNRAAAQESRDKKRRYVAQLESDNKRLQEENERLTKRTKFLESQQEILNAQLAIFSRFVTEMQKSSGRSDQSEVPLILDGFCGSARIAKRKCLWSLTSLTV